MTAYTVGGLVRVTRDAPAGADLTTGQVLTVVAFGIDDELGAFAYLTPGGWAVPLTDLEPVADHDVLHPEDAMPLDAEEADAWGDILDLDPALRDLAATYDGTFDDIAARLDIERPTTTAPAEPPAGSAPVSGVGLLEASRPYEPADDDGYAVRAVETGELALAFEYGEHDCPNHGRERGITVRFPGGSVPLPIEVIPALIRWMSSRVDKARDRAAEDDA